MLAGGRPRVRAIDVQTVKARLARAGCLLWVERLCIESGEAPGDVLGRDRHPAVVRVRHEVWTVVRHTLGLSYPETARMFGVDHTTVMSAERKYLARRAA